MTARYGHFRGGGQAGWRTRPVHGYATRTASDLEQGPSRRLTGIGAALREARERRDISHATAERETHIPRHHLQALEEERFEAFHAPVYVRGFLRSYSQYLGLDSTTLLALLPADSPPEDERLLPLSSLGRPRGPREAAQARGDPAQRDAPPLTEAFERPGAEDIAREWNPPRPGAGRLTEHPPLGRVQQATRLDPLGRLGWPERLDEPLGAEQFADTEAYLAPPQPRPRDTFSKPDWDQPLVPRRANRTRSFSSSASVLPNDVSPLFQPNVLLACAGAALLTLLLLIAALAVFGGDGDPQVFATGVAPSAASVAIRAPAGQPGAHGNMPDVQGADLKTALTALQQAGAVPIVITQGAPSSPSAHVSGQAPAPGSALGSDTPTLVVVGSSN